MKTPRNAAGFNPFEQSVIDRAESYMATRFEGRGRYTKLPAATLSDAMAKGQTLRCPERGVMIYAIAGRSQTLITTLAPLPRE